MTHFKRFPWISTQWFDCGAAVDCEIGDLGGGVCLPHGASRVVVNSTHLPVTLEWKMQIRQTLTVTGSFWRVKARRVNLGFVLGRSPVRLSHADLTQRDPCLYCCNVKRGVRPDSWRVPPEIHLDLVFLTKCSLRPLIRFGADAGLPRVWLFSFPFGRKLRMTTCDRVKQRLVLQRC